MTPGPGRGLDLREHEFAQRELGVLAAAGWAGRDREPPVVQVEQYRVDRLGALLDAVALVDVPADRVRVAQVVGEHLAEFLPAERAGGRGAPQEAFGPRRPEPRRA